MDQANESEIFSKTVQALATATEKDVDLLVEAVRNVDLGRLQRIEALRKAVAKGQYEPNVEELSKRIIDEHLGS